MRRQLVVALRSVRERNRVVSMFGQHVAPGVVNQLLRQDVELQSERRDVCVMLLDIQGLIALAEEPGTRDDEAATEVVTDFPRRWQGSGDETHKAILATIPEKIRVRPDEMVQITPRPRDLELVRLGMLNGLRARHPEAVPHHLQAGGRCGRGERT